MREQLRLADLSLMSAFTKRERLQSRTRIVPFGSTLPFESNRQEC